MMMKGKKRPHIVQTDAERCGAGAFKKQAES